MKIMHSAVSNNKDCIPAFKANYINLIDDSALGDFDKIVKGIVEGIGNPKDTLVLSEKFNTVNLNELGEKDQIYRTISLNYCKDGSSTPIKDRPFVFFQVDGSFGNKKNIFVGESSGVSIETFKEKIIKLVTDFKEKLNLETI